MRTKARPVSQSLSEQSFAALVASVTDYAIFLIDLDGRVATWNAGAQRIHGYRANEIIGAAYEAFYTPEDLARGAPAAALNAAAGNGRYTFEGWRIRKDGSRFWASVVLTAVRNAEFRVCGFLKVTRDMTERRAREALLEGQRRVLEGVANARPLAENLEEIVRMMEAQSRDMKCSVLLVQDGRLRHGAAPSLPEEYNRALDGIAIGPAVGSFGAAAYHRRPVYVADVRTDALWADYRDLARRAGLRACWSTPVCAADGEVLATFAMYYDEPRLPEPGDERLVDVAMQLARVAIEHERAGRRLKESEARLQAFMAFSPMVMFIKDREGRYLMVNDEFLRAFGLTRGEVVGRGDREIFSPEQAERVARSDAEVFGLGGPIQSEETARYTFGERVSIVSKFPIRGARGEVVALGGVATDISERKRAEQSLRESERLLADAQRLAGLGNWEWDLGSGRLLWSEELYRIYGVTPASFVPTYGNYIAAVHPDDRPTVARVIEGAIADRRGFRFSERIVRPDGEVRYLRSVGEPVLDQTGAVCKVFGACLDVTEHVRAETALRRYAEEYQALAGRLVEVQERERRQIARELHDRVGQNLTALEINLDIIMDRLAAGRIDAARERLLESRKVVDAMGATIVDVMDDLRPPLLDEYGLAAALRWSAEAYSRRTGIAVDVHERGDTRGARDPDVALALYRIAQEALNNVAKHARATRVGITLETGAATLRLSVADDGVGFDSSEKSPRRGWGMTTMRERAEAFGGRIEVTSAPGKGTVVAASVRA